MFQWRCTMQRLIVFTTTLIIVAAHLSVFAESETEEGIEVVFIDMFPDVKEFKMVEILHTRQ